MRKTIFAVLAVAVMGLAFSNSADAGLFRRGGGCRGGSCGSVQFYSSFYANTYAHPNQPTPFTYYPPRSVVSQPSCQGGQCAVPQRQTYQYQYFQYYTSPALPGCAGGSCPR